MPVPRVLAKSGVDMALLDSEGTSTRAPVASVLAFVIIASLRTALAGS